MRASSSCTVEKNVLWQGQQTRFGMQRHDPKLGTLQGGALACVPDPAAEPLNHLHRL